ncbi:MAG TPA: hypothetical protein VFP72_24680 [Kineosporiaceae bacterium]|nr:hypothetical protein [Kineosporiaceae bacterium]
MSKTVPGEYRGVSFWVYDLAQAILFAQMAEEAAAVTVEQRSPWLDDLEEDLRVHAVCGGNLAFDLDDWCAGHEEEFLALVAQAAARLTVRGAITAQEAAEWVVIDGRAIFLRGADVFPTAPVVQLAHALTDIVHGSYPKAPPGREWYFGLPEGVITLVIHQPDGPDSVAS